MTSTNCRRGRGPAEGNKRKWKKKKEKKKEKGKKEQNQKKKYFKIVKIVYVNNIRP